MTTNELRKLNPNFVPCGKPVKKHLYSLIYYIFGIFLSILFILPLMYMIAASTKSETAIGESSGT